ncbi:MAG: DUF86 domain-containing protein [Candidatus Omnitrophota bacterium]|jgi:uncharacterized protein with HEPN domain
MSKRADKDLLSDIKESILRINRYSDKVTYAEFMRDTKIQDAVVRNIEIIGEAVKNLSEAERRKYPKVPWKELAKMRDRLIHHYFGVNYEIVWSIIREELPNIAAGLKMSSGGLK